MGGGGGTIKIGWEGDLLGGFSQVEGMSKLSVRGRGLPPSFPVGEPIYIYIYVYIYMYIYICIYIYIYTIVLAYVLIPLANHNSVIFFVSQGTEKLNKLPQAHKNP